MAKLFANIGDPDHTPHSLAFDLGLHCLLIILLGSPDYNGAGLGGSVGCAVRLETRLQVQPPLRSATFFCGD